MQNITSTTSQSDETTFSVLFITIGALSLICIWGLMWKTGIGNVLSQISGLLSCLIALLNIIPLAMLIVGLLVATGVIELPQNAKDWAYQKMTLAMQQSRGLRGR